MATWPDATKLPQFVDQDGYTQTSKEPTDTNRDGGWACKGPAPLYCLYQRSSISHWL